MKMGASFSAISDSAAATSKWGQRLGTFLQAGDVVLLFSTLGGGKTTFTQGLLKGLGGRDLAQSPTFVMAQTLAARVPLHHMDFYRLTPAELLAKGVDDYFTGQGAIAPGVVVVEWPERCPQLWPKERIDVKITLRRLPTERKIQFYAHGDRFGRMLTRMNRK
jgi:tRNA threonylcarbamoyladenosine biosynthesis protein TsaE